MTDQRTPRDRGTGKDPEDYPSEAGPARVGKAPLPLNENSDRLPAGVAPPLPATKKPEKVKEMAQAATTSDHGAMDKAKEQEDRPDTTGLPRDAGSTDQEISR